MSSVLDDESQRVVQLRAAITEEPRGFGECASDIENRNGLCSLLDGSQLTQSLIAQFLKKLVLKLAGALVCAENFCFHLLQLWHDKTFAADSGLFARVALGHVAQIRFRYL